jgi:hypothetical protein
LDKGELQAAVKHLGKSAGKKPAKKPGKIKRPGRKGKQEGGRRKDV